MTGGKQLRGGAAPHLLASTITVCAMHKPYLRGRAVTTLLMLFGSVVLAVSGVVLLVVPRGRTAHALDWSLMSLSKETWEEGNCSPPGCVGATRRRAEADPRA